MEILGQMVHHVTDQLVLMGILYVVEPALMSNRLTNVGPRRVGDARYTWNAHQWEIR